MKGRPFGILKTQLVAKHHQKIEGGPFGDKEIFEKKRKMRILKQSHPEYLKGETFGFCGTSVFCKISKKLEGGPFEGKKISLKKSHSAEKN